MALRQIERSKGVSRTPKPDLGFEPLPAVIDEADQGHRSPAHPRGKLHQSIELGLGRRVEHPVAAQGSKPVALVPEREQFVVQHEQITRSSITQMRTATVQ
jgi:hypothetical protein